MHKLFHCYVFFMSKRPTPVSTKGRRTHQLHTNASRSALAGGTRAVYLAMGFSAGLLALGVVALLMQRSKGSEPVATATVAAGPTLLTYSIVAEYPHDPQAFTQGIQYDRECNSQDNICVDIYWESTGMYGQSTVRKVELQSGKVKQSVALPTHDFGEGLVKLGDNLFQLLWRTGMIYKYSVAGGTINKIGGAQGPLRDGWGLTTDGRHLIATDSSSYLIFIDPVTLQEVKRIQVQDGGVPVQWLNELELIDGELWANVWQTECIARINITTGQVTHWVMMHGLMHSLRVQNPQHVHMDVLNGIAYDAKGGRLFVTGKMWPKIFEVKVQPGKLGVTLDSARRMCIKQGSI